MTGLFPASCLVALAFALTAATGCATVGLRNNVYDDGDAAFRLSSTPPQATGDSDPRGWSRVTVEDNDLAWSSNGRLGVIALNGACRAAMADNDSGDAPLFVLANHLMFGMTERNMIKREMITMSGREALHTVAEAQLDGVPIRFEAFILKKDGCVFDLQYVAAPDRFEQGRPTFEQVVKGFDALGPSGRKGTP
jgi:hypothetical protein